VFAREEGKEKGGDFKLNCGWIERVYTDKKKGDVEEKNENEERGG